MPMPYVDEPPKVAPVQGISEDVARTLQEQLDQALRMLSPNQQRNWWIYDLFKELKASDVYDRSDAIDTIHADLLKIAADKKWGTVSKGTIENIITKMIERDNGAIHGKT